MLVNICGALWILSAAWGAVEIGIMPFFSHGTGFLAPRLEVGMLIFVIAQGVIGFGLIKRNRLARWWSLGPFMLSPLGILLAIGIGVMAWGAMHLTGEVARNADRFASSISFASTAAGYLWPMAILAFVGSVIDFRCFFHLRSDAGCEEFGVSTHESFLEVFKSLGANILVIVVLMKSGLSFPIHGAAIAVEEGGAESSVPAGRASEDEEYRSSEIAAFSGDGSHLLIQTPGLSTGWFLVDLGSSKTSRPPLHAIDVENSRELAQAISPDGKLLFGRFGKVVVATGAAQPLAQYAPATAKLLGFGAAHDYLIYDADAKVFALINLDDGQRKYTVPPWGGAPGEYSTLSTAWSPLHDRFSWFDGDITVSTLELATGKVTTANCADCAGRKLNYADDGSALLLSGTDSGTLVLLPSGEVKRIPLLEGAPDYFATYDSGPAAVWLDPVQKQLIWQSLDATNSWRATFERVRILGVGKNKDLIVQTSYDNMNPGFGHAQLIDPTVERSLEYTELMSNFKTPEFRCFTPDHGGILLESEDGNFEITRFSDKKGGSPRRFVVNVVKGGPMLPNPRNHYSRIGFSPYFNEYEPDGSLHVNIIYPKPSSTSEEEPADRGPREPVTRDTAPSEWRRTAPANDKPAPPPDPRRMVKCRDGSGGMTYTQGTCPPGTTPVE